MESPASGASRPALQPLHQRRHSNQRKGRARVSRIDALPVGGLLLHHGRGIWKTSRCGGIIFKVVAGTRCASVQSVYFSRVNATLTELRRETSRVLRPVIHGAKTVTLTEHGQEVAEISPKTTPDRKRALELLAAIGPVELQPRKCELSNGSRNPSGTAWLMLWPSGMV